MKVVHDWLKDYIGDLIPSAEKVEELLTFHAFEVEGREEVVGHEVIDIKILPDRGADCLSHRGIAREIASITGIPLVFDPLLNQERLPLFSDIEVTIADTKACTRFSAALVNGIEVKDSPEWLQNRLRALGQRPINNIVDATNYVMYAIGQPIHAYDADKFPQVDGTWKFDVRFAQKGETVSLIAEGGKQEDRIVTLQGTELLIVDGSSNCPIGLAGVKGGAYAGVDTKTSKIIIEAAHFDAVVVRKTARRLGIVIDASKRFENNLSQGLVPHALRDVVELIIKIAGGTCEGSVDVVHEGALRPQVVLHVTHVNALLGLCLTKEVMVEILKRIGATVEDKGEFLSLTASFERMDLNIPEDYIEEIGRIYGYNHVVSTVPASVPLSEMNVRHYYSEEVRKTLIGTGFSEVITSSFVAKDDVQLQNALASDKSYLRSNLKNNIGVALDKNANLADLLGAHDTRVFEIGTVFSKEGGSIAEHVSLCLGVRTKVGGYTAKDDVVLSEVMQKLEETLGTKIVCEVGNGTVECNFTEVFSTLPIPTAYKKVDVAEEIVYTPFSVYPAMTRDIALWVGEGTESIEVEAVINQSSGDLRLRTTLVDVFTKEGRTSYAFRLVFLSYKKTLTDDEVNSIMEEVYRSVTEKGWEVR